MSRTGEKRKSRAVKNQQKSRLFLSESSRLYEFSQSNRILLVIPSSQSVNEESSTVHTLNPSIEAADAEILRVYDDIVKDYPDLIIETGRTETTISYKLHELVPFSIGLCREMVVRDNSNKDSLAAGTIHRWKAFGAEYFSKPQRLFTYSISTRFGGYYANGNRYSINADMGYRFQPYVSITLSTVYNLIQLPQPWGNTRFWLIGPRIDVTFTNKLFLTTFIQYNNQQKNINLNARFQWRYHPASDLFLVYTDNYYSSPLFVRNRAFVLKFTYWWNN